MRSSVNHPRENEVSAIVLDCCIRIHEELGPGLLESVYETALEFELTALGLRVERQRGIPVVYKGVHLEDGFRADLIVEGCVIIEVKSLEVVPKVAYKILLTYLRLSGIRLGLMVNFGAPLLKDGFERIANRMPYR